jgi:hypothetical protein
MSSIVPIIITYGCFRNLLTLLRAHQNIMVNTQNIGNSILKKKKKSNLILECNASSMYSIFLFLVKHLTMNIQQIKM